MAVPRPVLWRPKPYAGMGLLARRFNQASDLVAYLMMWAMALVIAALAIGAVVGAVLRLVGIVFG